MFLIAGETGRTIVEFDRAKAGSHRKESLEWLRREQGTNHNIRFTAE